MTILRGLGARLAALFMLAAGAARADDTPQSLYEQAKKEGKISIWSSLDVDLHQKLQKAFAKHYPGIEVEAFKIQPGPAVERAIAEARANRLTVDIMDTNSAYLPLLFDRDLVKSYPFDKVFGVSPDHLLFDKRAIMIAQYDLPITYNTQLVKPGEITSWEDLTQPKWKGKFLLEARGFGLAILAQTWGEQKTIDYVKRLVANKPIITKGALPTTDGLAGGQAAAAIGAYGARIELVKAQGAPVEWARVGPVPAQLVTVVAVNGAPHPAAAKLWAAFWATPEAQKIFYDEQRYGLLTGSTANPRGKELQKLGIPVVVETTKVEEGRRLLELVAKTIDGLK
jgi:iron(III) transport system substrate-binding protein